MTAMTLRAIRRLWPLACVVLCTVVWAQPPEAIFDFKAPQEAQSAETAAALRDLATRVLPVFQDEDTDRYLADLSVLQLVAGEYQAASDSRWMLRDRRRSADAGRPLGGRAALFDLYATAKAIEAARGLPFQEAFAQAFRENASRLTDRDAYDFGAWASQPATSAKDALQRALDRTRGKDGVTQAQAVELMWVFVTYEAGRGVGPIAAALVGEDERRRYIDEQPVALATRSGATVYVRVVRSRQMQARLPALLEFTLGGAADEARIAAAHGYVGVVAYVRGSFPPPAAADKDGARARAVEPFVHDGEDARAVIEWIAVQPWSDGRVGMIGRGYSGFAAWAAMKRGVPAALKAVATADPMAPGIDFPMQGAIVRNSALRWADAVVNGFAGRRAAEEARWRELDAAWYRSGARYRDLDRYAPRRSPLFRSWLDHPSYDRWWRAMIPVGEEFAAITIPVLTTTGYYAQGQAGALHYFNEHLRARPDASHTLLAGPYEDGAAARPAGTLRGYAVDDAALIDLRELRYDWLDHVFKNRPRPELLKDRVNLQLMGGDTWRHAPAPAALAPTVQRYYLAPAAGSDPPRLRAEPPASAEAFVQQALSPTSPADAEPWPPSAVQGPQPVARHALVYASEPVAQPFELAGRLSGRLDLTVSKQDVDLYVALYEQLAGGDYLLLAEPYEFRASYAGDRSRRRLLPAGVRTQLSFAGERLMARRVQAGSRLVLVAGVSRRSDRQINYGAGRAVSDESIDDAGGMLRVKWHAGSYVELPVQRP